MEKGILEEDWLQVVIFVLYYSVGARSKRSIVLLLIKYLFSNRLSFTDHHNL